MRQVFKQVAKALLLLAILFVTPESDAQDSFGGQLFTKESYQYGRFEVRMQSAEGDGIISSFFLYNLEAGKNCQWPAENNEIDVEMTGNDQQLYFTTHHPDPFQPWSIGEIYDLGFNPHGSFHTYAIEWEPGIVRWFVDGNLIYVQDEQPTENLIYPMAIMMNLWAAPFEDWAGVWDPAVMPRNSVYDYVSYAEYTPGGGSVGTNGSYTPVWKDDFDVLDTARWEISDFDQINHLTFFRENNVELSNGHLRLHLTEPVASTEEVPVTFSVNVSDANLIPSDVVFLNGSFNNWCGTCSPMVMDGDVWSLTLNLSPNKYEYLFTVNGWEKRGGAPLNSQCDFKPCDEFPNYGIYIPEGSNPEVLPTRCWATCESCLTTSTKDPAAKPGRVLVDAFDLLGRPVVDPEVGQLVIYIYSDGTIEKKMTLE